jgi:hypothetical protein
VAIFPRIRSGIRDNEGAFQGTFMRKHSAAILLAFLTVAGLLPARPASAQADIAGQWATRQHEDGPERGAGPSMVEFEGLPINPADRMRGLSWSASIWTVPEHQCIPHPADYGPNFSQLAIWKDIDPFTREVVAFHTEMSWMNPVRTIWMDGRPRPPAAAMHTWQGFSLGKWEGDMLTVETTHLKPGYVRRNGLARSEKATVREHFIRNGNFLTWITIVTDPVYLTEPYIKSRNFALDPGYQMAQYPCSVDIEVARPEGEIPHYLPNQNPFVTEHAVKNKLPLEAALGGAETMYPEFMAKMKTLPNATPPPATPAAPAPAAAPPAAGARRGNNR